MGGHLADAPSFVDSFDSDAGITDTSRAVPTKNSVEVVRKS